MRKTSFLAVIFFCCILLSLCAGRYSINILQPFSTAMDYNVFFKIRLPRVILVGISGGALALSGFVYQSLFRNPLVSPDVLGVSSGSSLGAIIGILFFGSNPTIIQALAFICGITVVIISLLLSKAMGGQRLFSMILSGIIIGSLANSTIMALKYVADPNRHLQTIEYWLMGSFNNTVWNDIYRVLPLFILSTAVLFAIKKPLKALTLGEEDAQSLGVNVGLITTIAIIFSTILVSSVVSVCGIVSWVGLIVPHMTRIFAGEDYFKNFNQSIFLGGILLIVADTLARSLFSVEIPISILTSLMGAIFLVVFLYIRNRW